MEKNLNSYSALKRATAESGHHFSPLNEAGWSSWEATDSLSVQLLTPDPSQENAPERFYLFCSLVSLVGFSKEATLALCRKALELNLPGRLPLGLSLFHLDQEVSLYLGGQYDSNGLDGAGLSALADDFVRCCLQVKSQLADLSAKLTPATGAAEERGVAFASPDAPGEESSLEDLLRQGQSLLKI
jgi:hypothetical protein